MLGTFLLSFFSLGHQEAPASPQGRAEAPSIPQAHADSGPTVDISGGRERQKAWLLGMLGEWWGTVVGSEPTAAAGQDRAGLKQMQGQGGAGLEQMQDQVQGGGLPGQLLPDAVSFAAFAMLRLTIGAHTFPPFASLSTETRVQCQGWVLQFVHRLLRLQADGGITCFDDLLCLAKQVDRG